MKFGKLADIENVDFRLPSDAAFNQEVLAKLSESELPHNFYIGCTGWSMKEWIGKVYPEGAKSKDFLRHYTRQFNTIELNTTHYRIPSQDTINKWYKESADDFRFCPKIPQTISHSRDLGINGPQIRLFCKAIEGLKEKLGCCFMQLPPYFGFDRLHLLKRFLQEFPSQLPLAIEVRHESWFAHTDRVQAYLEALHKSGRQVVITDVAGRRDVLHMGISGKQVLIRFVGNDLHPTDYQRIDAWIGRLQEWYQRGLQEVFFFTHEPDNLRAPELADYLCKQFGDFTDIHTRGPKLFEPPGQQMKLF